MLRLLAGSFVSNDLGKSFEELLYVNARIGRVGNSSSNQRDGRRGNEKVGPDPGPTFAQP